MVTATVCLLLIVGSLMSQMLKFISKGLVAVSKAARFLPNVGSVALEIEWEHYDSLCEIVMIY